MTTAVVTGAAGFLGSHLCDALLARGAEVVGIDNLSTGVRENLGAALRSGRFRLVEADVCDGIDLPGAAELVYHLASPASPPDYLARPLATLRAGSQGTEATIAYALAHGARFVLASTSEVYGDPATHPQHEGYWGNVNPIGPRSVYDEAKRYAEALTMAHHRHSGLDAGIVRIFNTYGPRLRPGDGRVVSNFLRQALTSEPLTIYGDGTQTRSLCYVDDLVRGLVAMGECAVTGPVNLGNPHEVTIRTLADLILRVTGSASCTEHRPLPLDDPTRRCPDIDRARTSLGWAPSVTLEDGLRRTAEWFRAMVNQSARS